MVMTTRELMWLKALLASLGVFHDSAMHLYCDNQAALHIAKNSVFHEHTKYIELDCHLCAKNCERVILLFPMFHPHDNWPIYSRKRSERNSLRSYGTSWA